MISEHIINQEMINNKKTIKIYMTIKQRKLL